MTRADFLIANADLVATCAGAAPRRGAAQGAIAAMAGASIAARHGRIVAVGPAAQVARSISLEPEAVVVDGRGRTVVPGFVDSHTHAVFAGDRRDELARRLAGASYAEIAAAGGGIVRTVAATRAASEDTLVALARPRLAEALAQGTTTCEIKSGYGLDTASELRMLRAIRALGGSQPIEVSATFMGAHEIPVEYRGRRDAYIELVIDEMLPAVAREGLAEWNDVFCEQGVFTPGESRRILEAGQALGLKPRIHADELAASGGALTAAAVGAVTADHLIHVDDAGAAAMARAGVMATLLPAAAFFLKLPHYAPARMLVAHDVPVALATDLNPGGGFSPSMPFVMTLAIFAMGLTLEEALVAATINGAAALGRQRQVGSLEVGKQMDAVVIDGALADLVRVGAPVVSAVVKRGAVVHGLLPREAGMSMLASLPLHEFLTRVAAPTPTPGGGAVAAMAGACGTALAEMVAALPRTRQNEPNERAQLEFVLPALSAARARLETLAQLDVDAFDRLLRGFRLPKHTDEEQALRRAVIVDATKDATLVPLETARVCADALKLMETVAGAGNRAAAADLLVAIGIVRAAADGAAANVRANLETLDDQAFTASSMRRLAATLEDASQSAHRALGSLQA